MNEAPEQEKPGEEFLVEKKVVNRRSFLAFVAFIVAEVGGIWGWFWYRSLSKRAAGLSSATRNAFEINRKINAKFYSPQHLAPQFAKEKAVKSPRENGEYGLESDFDFDAWRLEVINPVSQATIRLDINSIKAFQKREVVFDFKCIEGWDQIVYYGGTRFSDFLLHYNLGVRSGMVADIRKIENWYNYAGLETPDGKYFVGIDMKSVLHPQTLLCYEQNAKDLEDEHGAPLRLIIPLKYGVKNIKRIGKLFFSDSPPRDYWHEDGYDYDLAL